MKDRTNVGSGRLLVIDDNPQNVLLIRGQLEREGYVVDSALNGQEGLDLALAQAPDLILLDIMMPGLDGYQVCQLLRENEPTRAVPVIVLTSLSDKADKTEGDVSEQLKKELESYKAKKPWREKQNTEENKKPLDGKKPDLEA